MTIRIDTHELITELHRLYQQHVTPVVAGIPGTGFTTLTPREQQRWAAYAEAVRALLQAPPQPERPVTERSQIAGEWHTPAPHPLLQYFTCTHLPDALQAVSKPFCELAVWVNDLLPDGPEKTVALRKLLESKDCAVRASLPPPATFDRSDV